MKLKNIKVGDLIVAKTSLLDGIDKGDICEVIAVEGSGYEGERTVSVSLKGEIYGWYNHEYFKKHRNNEIKKSEIFGRLVEHELRLAKLERPVEGEGKEVLSVGQKEIVGNELAKATLNQSVFNGLDKKWRFAAVDSNGLLKVFTYEPKLSVSMTSFILLIGNTIDIGEGYDNSDWKNSLIERESVELTGSDLARAMLERGDKCVLIRMGTRDDKQAKYIGRFAIATSIDESGRFNVISDQQSIGKVDFAVPINNMGEPLTTKDVGL